jgi:hypothetical protein
MLLIPHLRSLCLRQIDQCVKQVLAFLTVKCGFLSNLTGKFVWESNVFSVVLIVYLEQVLREGDNQ